MESFDPNTSSQPTKTAPSHTRVQDLNEELQQNSHDSDDNDLSDKQMSKPNKMMKSQPASYMEPGVDKVTEHEIKQLRIRL